jgi:hypothetical protein
MKCYRCCLCQTEHAEDAPLFDAHLMWQSKHGIYEVDIETALKAALMQQEMRDREQPEEQK